MQGGRFSAASVRFSLLLLLLVFSPSVLTAQTHEPLDLIYRGEFDELGWEKSDLLHVAVVLTVRGGCRIDEARADEFDAAAYMSAWKRLIEEDQDLALVGIGSALHPTARRLGPWLQEAGATKCSDDAWQQLLLNAARYVIAYGEHGADRVEAQKDAWWATLGVVRAAEEVARWDVAGWVSHRVGSDLALQNRDEVVASLAAKLASLPTEQLQRCSGIRLRVLFDADGRVVDVFGRHEASSYSSYNSDSRSQRLWESARNRCGQQLPIVKEAVRSMEIRPARTPEGLDVPIWVPLLVDLHPRMQPFGITLQTHAWAWRLRDGSILSATPWRLEPYSYNDGRRRPAGTADVGRQPGPGASERLEELKVQGPSVTPLTVAPKITNPDAVREALERHHPPTLRAQGVGGNVDLWILVDTNGAVTDVRLAGGSGEDAQEDDPDGFERNPVANLPPPPGGAQQPPSRPHDALAAAALEVAAVMEFSPALNGNTPVPVWIRKRVTFTP